MGLTAALCAVFVAGMVGMSFAAVPLYRLFCQVTGYGGTTQQAEAAPTNVLDRSMSVRFDANIANGLGWSFRPAVRQVDIKVGETGEVTFIAENRGTRTTTGTAVFNVSPLLVGAYFNKIACFCFTEQTLAPGESVEMPVTFFIDPAIQESRDLNSVHTVTLSYTFYPAETEVSAMAGEDRVF
ncbi:MAG: cytochrome c oxidase assembly protein [Hyphomicrobiales bacterium]|nr:cytochrome c oxidase assembly protein [Hyphomicrobiales bacterium]